MTAQRHKSERGRESGERNRQSVGDCRERRGQRSRAEEWIRGEKADNLNNMPQRLKHVPDNINNTPVLEGVAMSDYNEENRNCLVASLLRDCIV